MSKVCKKYMDVDVFAFLEAQMKSNTVLFQSDFDIDKKNISSYMQSQYKEDKTFLWLSRLHGTVCVNESDAFIRDTDAHITWRYFAEQKEKSCLAFAVELTGVKDGIIRGNCFELNFAAHAAEMVKSSVALSCVINTFRDGFQTSLPLNNSTYSAYKTFREKHGSIVRSFGIPQNKELHACILAEQKRKRDSLREGSLKVPLAEQIKAADSKNRQHILSDSRHKKDVIR